MGINSNQKSCSFFLAIIVGLFFCLIAGYTAHAVPAYSILHTFNAYGDGYGPATAPTYSPDGNYYGITANGGTNLQGTIYKLTPNGNYTTIHSFCTNSDGYADTKAIFTGNIGYIYGVNTAYQYWRINTDGSGFRVLLGLPTDIIAFGSDGYLYGALTSGGATGYGYIFRTKIDGTQLTPTILYNFTAADGVGTIDRVAVSSSGFYGTTSSGGSNSDGLIFSLQFASPNVISTASFGQATGSYATSLLVGLDSNIYGTTYSGGTIFRYNPTSNELSVIFTFGLGNNYAIPSDMKQGNDGNFYGITWIGGIDAQGNPGNGVIFRVSSTGTNPSVLYTILHNNSEGTATGGNISIGNDGVLRGFKNTSVLGATNGMEPGFIYSLALQPDQTYHFVDIKQFSNFPSDGQNPYIGNLTVGQDRSLYGVTAGIYMVDYESFRILNCYVYHVDPYSSGYSLDSYLYCTSIPSGSILSAPDGNYYLPTNDNDSSPLGALYDFNPSDDTLPLSYSNIVSDYTSATGSSPSSGLILGSDGGYYGVTAKGGANSDGVVYRLAPGGSPETVLYSFTGSSDSGSPIGNVLQASDGNFYGVCNGLSTTDYGTVWKLTPTGVLTTLHTFAQTDGAKPLAGLIEGFDGYLYGTTSSGGANSVGNIFKLKKDGTSYTDLHDFVSATDGATPYSGITQTSDGTLYGTTSAGGKYGYGTAYSLSTSGSSFTVLHAFKNAGVDGATPYAGLTEATDGNLYGTTYTGGVSPYPGTDVQGTVYKLATTLPTINSFSPSSGIAGNTVTIIGTNLTGVTQVHIGVGLASIVSQSDTQIVVTVPTNASTGRITLINPKKKITSFTNWTYLAPTISSFTPAHGAVGTTVVITGTNIAGVQYVKFNKYAATTYSVDSATQITATVPTGATSGKITVTTPGGTASSSTSFKIP